MSTTSTDTVTTGFPPQGALVWMMLASVWVLLVTNWGWLLGVLGLSFLWGWLRASIKQRWWLAGACLLTTWSFVLSQGLFYRAEELSPLLELPWLGEAQLVLSQEGVGHGLKQSLRWNALLLLAAGLLVRYHPDSLATGFQQLGLPTQVAFLFSLALQYLPWIAADTLAVLRIARLRGCQRWQWIVIMPSLIRSLMAANMRRADTITLAMLAKGLTSFSLPNSCSPTSSKLSATHKILLCSTSILVTSVIALRMLQTLLERKYLNPSETLSLITSWLDKWL